MTSLPPPAPPGDAEGRGVGRLPGPPPPPSFVPSAPASRPGRRFDPGVVPPSATKGLRTATLVLFWCLVGATWLLVVAAFNRKRVFDELRRGDVFFPEFAEADDVVVGSGALQVGIFIAAIIVLSIWSLRTARHAKQCGADVSPGLACGGWYIPFGNFVVPFVQLRRVAALRARPTTALNWWQGLFIAQFVASTPVRTLGDVESVESIDDISGRLSAQAGLAVVWAVLLTAMTIAVVRATRDVDGTERRNIPDGSVTSVR